MIRTDLYMLLLLLATIALPVWAVQNDRPDSVEPMIPVVPDNQADPVITVETPVGVATISGPAAEYVLHSAFPVRLP